MIYEPIRLRFAQLGADALSGSAVQQISHISDLTEACRGVHFVQSPENDFAFAKNPLTESARGRPGHVVPIDVLNLAAAVADEV